MTRFTKDVFVKRAEEIMTAGCKRVREDTLAAEAMAAQKDPRAIEPLIGALADKSAEVRTAAEHALEQLSGQFLGSDPAKWQAWWNGCPRRGGWKRLAGISG